MTNEDDEELKDWFLELISEFRSAYQELPEERKGYIWNVDNFYSPCQVIALSLEQPKLTFVYVTHDRNRTDLEVLALHQVPFNELLGKLERILSDKSLYRSLSIEEREGSPFDSLGKYLEDQFIEIYNLAKAPPQAFTTFNNKNIIGAKLSAMLDGFHWMMYVDPLEVKAELIVKSILEETKSREEEARNRTPKNTTPPIGQDEELIKGYATYFSPHVWVGEVPKFTFRNRIEGMAIFPTPVFPTKYKGKSLVLNQKGLLFIEGNDKRACIDMMNEIIGTFIFQGYDFDIVRETDIGEFSVRKKDMQRSHQAYPMSPTRYWQAEHDFGGIDESILESAVKLEPDSAFTTIKESESMTQDPTHSRAIISFAQSKAHQRNSEYLESFVMSWLIIERLLRRKWSVFVEKKNVAGRRKKKLVEWSIDMIIEQLALSHEISETVYDDLILLKGKRNDVNHEGYVNSKSDAAKCLNVAENLLREVLHLDRNEN